LLNKLELENLQTSTAESLREEALLREKENNSHVESVSRLKEEHERVIAQLKSNEEERIAQLSQQHDREIAAEREIARNLASDVDEERHKRRRVEREKKYHEAEAHRHKAQLTVAGNSSGTEVLTAIKEMKQMQQQLDAANLEIQALKARGNLESSSLESGGITVAAATAPALQTMPSTTTTTTLTGGRLGSSRPVRVKVSDRDVSSGMQSSVDNAVPMISGAYAMSGSMGGGSGAGCFGGFLEQAELTDKRIEQLTRERRELIAKNLEENKERMELSQKLLTSEKEVAALKSKITKLTLEKERMERKMAKSEGVDDGEEDDMGKENAKKQKVSSSASLRTRRACLETI